MQKDKNVATKHNIETLTEDLQKFKTSFQIHRRDVNKRLDSMQPQVQEMHEYIIEQRGYERGASTNEKGAGLNINSEVLKLLGLALMIIAALVGARAIQ